VITKRTDQLRPGDVVKLYASPPRTIASVQTTEFNGLLRVRYEPIEISGANGGVAEEDAQWDVIEPSKLDLAVQRAQELADSYPAGGTFLISEQLKDFSQLLALFRAAR
jgi:hypothetical protein